MIEKISAIHPAAASLPSHGGPLNYDIHNMSPNEMDALSLALFNRGEITLKQRLPFVPLQTEQGTRLQYYSRVWEDPDRKRDMLAEFNQVLQDQINGGAGKASIDSTREAIALLEKLDQRQSFEDILKNTMADR